VSQTGAPGRYQRSTNGLVASVVVVVVLVVGFVVVRSLFSRDVEVEPEPVAYLEAVGAAQAAGFEVAYPPALPSGWVATSVELAPAGQEPAFGLGVLTDEGRFIGLRQEDDSVEDLLAELVDEDTSEVAPVSVGGLVETWAGYADEGGDTAYAAELGEDTLLVYGSAPDEDLRTMLSLLVTDPL
jgi:hypothetical protein